MNLDFIVSLLKASWLSNLLLFLSLIVTSLVAFFTIRNVNKNTSKQIENQNKQNYRPYLNARIIKISDSPIDGIDIFGLKGDRYYEAYLSKGYMKVKAINLYLLLELENYGNGLIDQLNLFDYDKEISLFRDDAECNSEISNDSYRMSIKKDGIMQVQFKFKAAISPKKLYSILEKRTTDYCTLLFTYKDINGNLYSTKFMIDLYYEKKPLIKYELYGSEEHSGLVYDLKDNESELYLFLKRNSK